MAEYEVSLLANRGIFSGLAKQNMLFHQCISELIDNSIAATPKDEKFHIEVILINRNDEKVDVYIADNCSGMSLVTFKDALQLGESATTVNRLNEHGFGMKNALATLSGDNGFWKIWSKERESDNVISAEGPFGPKMKIHDKQSFPTEDFISTDVSTIIKVPVKLSFMQSVQGRGAPSKDLEVLRSWLVEHLGVYYRGYLEQDINTVETSGVITVSINRDRMRVPPVPVPLGSIQTEYFDVELGGEVYTIEYRYGSLDEVKRDKLVGGNKAKFFYQGNIPTQGIDIRLGKRVIATRQFETIWRDQKGARQLARHNHFNDFLGEVLIPELPRGILSTVNNKTDFNLDDNDWQKIFDKLNDFRPIKEIKSKSEADLREKWIDMLKATNPDDEVTDEKCVWPTGTRIDVFRKTPEGKIVIYELKTGHGKPLDLYQLKMYWDGLAIQNENPNEAVLLVEDYNRALEEMANKINVDLCPPNGSEPYDFKLEKHKDKGLS